MAVKPIPEGYHTVTPYLIIDDVRAVLDFVQQAFGARIVDSHSDEEGVIRHADVIIGDSHVMMGSARGPWKAMPSMLYLYVEDTDAMYQAALRAGATSVMEPSDQFYGDRNAGVLDSQGNQWWFATHVEDVPPEELAKRAQAAGR